MKGTIMFLNATAERRGTLQSRLTVPWLTVLLLAVVLAYADGFWMVSLRGAVGAIERTQGPFASWLREFTLVLPVFVLGVLGALTLALRRFGPVLRGWRTVLATALLIVAAGTLVGIAELAASAAYDYHLQSGQLQLMASMGDTCAWENCLAQQQQASLWLQVRALGYGSGILLLTNLVLVGWVVALRAGRLNVSTTRPHAAFSPTATNLVADGEQGSRVDDLRHLLVALLFGSAVIHGAVVPEHLSEWGAAGAFFVVLAAAELSVAVVLVTRRQPTALFAAVVVSIGPLALWLYSRTVGMPFGPEAGVPEQVGLPDIVVCALEISTLIVAVVLLRRRDGLLRRPPASAHVSWLTLVAVIAITAIGFAGTGLSGFDIERSGHHSAISVRSGAHNAERGVSDLI
ncbi:MAG: hypothetical protein HHJ13_09545 [Phycicoccus sp.]|nr:hypothetical protein [Phycicoccus sp.]